MCLRAVKTSFTMEVRAVGVDEAAKPRGKLPLVPSPDFQHVRKSMFGPRKFEAGVCMEHEFTITIDDESGLHARESYTMVRTSRRDSTGGHTRVRTTQAAGRKVIAAQRKPVKPRK